MEGSLHPASSPSTMLPLIGKLLNNLNLLMSCLMKSSCPFTVNVYRSRRSGASVLQSAIPSQIPSQVPSKGWYNKDGWLSVTKGCNVCTNCTTFGCTSCIDETPTNSNKVYKILNELFTETSGRT
eukprot:799437-Ditylum_brightwellii.AAC.1